jgi:uncharacterized protein YpiB (UPF0302 family)
MTYSDFSKVTMKMNRDSVIFIEIHYHSRMTNPSDTTDQLSLSLLQDESIREF